MSTLGKQIDTLVEANAYLQTQIKVMEQIIKDGSSEQKFCRSCIHFIQHYTLDTAYIKGFAAIECGHCIKSKQLNIKKPTNKACENYEYGRHKLGGV